MTDTHTRSAEISDDGLYRLLLTRRWAPGPPVTFIMCNPSTADDVDDDPTTRRCITFATRLGAGALHLVNLYAYRTPHPAELGQARRAGIGINGGPEALDTIAAAAAESLKVIAAWGKRPPGITALGHNARIRTVKDRLAGKQLWCLAVNADGSPGHPLYLPADAPLVAWPVRGQA